MNLHVKQTIMQKPSFQHIYLRQSMPFNTIDLVNICLRKPLSSACVLFDFDVL